ncbi:MAG: class I SAM-dependent methyltransferase [Acidobacteriia bacterium]|nr:class I SAM-dependent methyltransferase [Terriglobia bacterium]
MNLRSRGLLLAGLLLAAAAGPRAAVFGGPGGPPRSDRFTPFVPTPPLVVEKMLELAAVGPDDIVYDLGSGDGRIVIAAAQKFGARAVGVEIRSELWKESSEAIARLGLEKRVRILHDDMFAVELGPATVVTLYQLTDVNDRLRPLLEKKLRPGTRVVANDFPIPGWTPQEVVNATSENGSQYKLFLYVRP